MSEGTSRTAAGSNIRTIAAKNKHFRDFGERSLALPPYQLRRQTMIYTVGHWPADVPLPPLPEGLSPSPERTGIIGCYDAPEGRPLAPGKLHFGAIAVQETHAPDGTQAAYIFAAGYEGEGMELLSHHINDSYRPARVALEPTGEIWSATATYPGGTFSQRVRPNPNAPHVESGTNFYMGPLNGQTVGYSVTYALNSLLAEVVELRVDLPDDHPLAVFRRFVPDVCLAIPDISMTYSPSYPVELATPTRASILDQRREVDALTTGTLDVFARIGRSLAIVDDQGRVLYANAGAERILDRLGGDGPPRLGPPGRATWQHEPLMAEGVRLTLPLSDGGTAVARVMPISLRLSDRPALMVLMDDPAEAGPFDPGILLRLYGLTPSEARLAVLVGQGQPPAQAAQALGITGETARTVLKGVYGKLAINRQAELARIVTRLEMV